MRWIIVIILAVIALNWGPWTAIGVFALGAIVLLVLQYQSPQTVQNSELKSVDHSIDEDSIFRLQGEFGKSLENTAVPDAVPGKEIYIYHHLMRPWYDKLSSEKRYDEVMTQKLRGDWLDYMEAVKDRHTYNFLWLEAGDDNSSAENFRKEEEMASRKMFAIQDAFAAAVGEDAVKKLAHMRTLSHFAFDHDGNLLPAKD